MLDPDFIRDNPDKVKQSTRNRGYDPQLVDNWLDLDKQWRNQIQEVEEIRQQRNELVEEYKQKGEKPPQEVINKGKQLKQELQKKEDKLQELVEQRKQAGYQIPNISAGDVPVGKDETENQVIKTRGKKPKFDFEPKDHLELGEELDLIDVENAAKVSGARFGYLLNDAALLEFALIQFALETLVREGFTPIVPPVMIKKEMEEALGYMEHGGWDDMYVLDKDDLVLVATAEHSLVAKKAGQTIETNKLPKRYVGFSTCFRREAGTYGKDTQGIFRVHQFDKVEMVSFVNPDESEQEQEYLVSLEEKLMQALKLPYQISKMCTGDLAQPQSKRYDVLTWMPSQDKYRETHSCSNCTDYQARRLNIKNDQGEYVHTLNGTAYAIGRILIAIIENYQQKDGSVKIPKVLQKYVGKKVIE